jgi:hypothetical protein
MNTHFFLVNPVSRQVLPIRMMKAHVEAVVKRHSFLTTALYRSNWSAEQNRKFIPANIWMGTNSGLENLKVREMFAHCRQEK